MENYPIDLDALPPGFTKLEHEPEFDPQKHLQLEKPETVFSLSDLGYSGDDLALAPSQFAATSVFRVLSDEGAQCLYEVAKKLEPFATSNPRIERNVRGGVYRSEFLRDLCLSQVVADFMGEIAGVPLMPHTIPHQLGHMNFNPTISKGNVDKWHVDTLRFDYVLFVTDPTKHVGGEFQYFKGTKYEMADLKSEGKSVPEDKIIAPAMPGPGYAIMQQGNLVVHQARGLQEHGERITMVNGYIASDPRVEDYSRYDQLCHADPEDVVTTEFSRHSAIQAKRLLDTTLLERQFDSNSDAIAEELEAVSALLQNAAQQIRVGKKDMEHFGDS